MTALKWLGVAIVLFAMSLGIHVLLGELGISGSVRHLIAGSLLAFPSAYLARLRSHRD